MMYCKACKTEYVQEMTFCPDCGTRLMSETEWEKYKLEEEEKRTRLRGIKMTPAGPVEGRVQAMQIVAILEQENIPVFVRTNEETAYDGLFVMQKGWGEIWVAENRLDQARQLMADLAASPLPLDTE